MNMAKGWKTVATNSTNFDKKKSENPLRDSKRFNSLMAKTEKKNVEQLKKEGEELFAQRKAEDAHLLDAFDRKVVKDKNAIKRAIKLKKDLAAAEEKAKKATQTADAAVNA
jgi:hypothetical protein